MIQLNRILVPIDFSDCANQALNYGSELAKRFGAELELLHVVQPNVGVYPYAAPLAEDAAQLEQSAQESLEQVEVPEAEALKGVTKSLRTGPPFVEIVRHAKEHDVDMIVIGTHGRTGIAHMLLGSVAERVVRKATCPVLTVRPDGHQFVMP